MPALTRPRHEAFAQAIFRGLFEPDKYPTNGHAYKAAGYKASNERKPTTNGSVSAAEVNASRLLRNANIIARVQELQSEAAKHAKEDMNKLVRELNEDRQLATKLEMPSAATAATLGKAKLLGLTVDKHEDVTKPRFEDAQSVNDVGIKLLQSVGYEQPNDADVALALAAHASLIEQLEAIAERALAGGAAAN